MQENYRKNRKETLAAVKELIIDRLGLDLSSNEIDDDAALFGAGLALDSIDALDLVIGVEEAFNIKIGEDELQVFRSVNSLVDHIITALGGDVPSVENLFFEKVPQVLNADVAQAYDQLRKQHIAYHSEHRIFEIEDNEEALEALSTIVSSDLSTLEPNKIAFTSILDRDGLVVDVAQIYMFEDKYWIFISYNIQASADAILQIGSYVSEITEQYTSLTLEGPYAWKLIRDFIGFEVLGLSYSRFMEAQVGDLSVVMGRISNTGEYGYRLTVSVDLEDELSNVLNALDTDQPINLISSDIVSAILSISTVEMRSPRMFSTVMPGDAPATNELRWMIGFRKNNFIGQDAIQNSIENVSTRVVAFVTGQAPSDTSSLIGAEINAGSEKVGHVRQLQYSPTLSLYVGYCELQNDWAYAGVKGLHIDHANAGEILTISTPAFLPLSSKVQMH